MDKKIILGLLLSYILLFICFIIALILPKLKVPKEITRKVVHIMISNWWIIALIYLNNYFALIPPITFLGLNYLSYKYKLVKGIERDDPKQLGTIFYPLAMILLVLFGISQHKLYIGAIGGLILGYSDGLATVFGVTLGKRKLYRDKTYVGSITMLVMSFMVTFIILNLYHQEYILLGSLVVAFSATFNELFITDHGIDNLSVPLLSSIVYYLFQLIVQLI